MSDTKKIIEELYEEVLITTSESSFVSPWTLDAQQAPTYYDRVGNKWNPAPGDLVSSFQEIYTIKKHFDDSRVSFPSTEYVERLSPQDRAGISGVFNKTEFGMKRLKLRRRDSNVSRGIILEVFGKNHKQYYKRYINNFRIIKNRPIFDLNEEGAYNKDEFQIFNFGLKVFWFDNSSPNKRDFSTTCEEATEIYNLKDFERWFRLETPEEEAVMSRLNSLYKIKSPIYPSPKSSYVRQHKSTIPWFID